MTLGQRISQHRKALNISQEELGARLGVSRQAVSKWETDLSAPCPSAWFHAQTVLSSRKQHMRCCLARAELRGSTPSAQTPCVTILNDLRKVLCKNF